MRDMLRRDLHLEEGFSLGERVALDYEYYHSRSHAIGTVRAVDERGRILDWTFERWAKNPFKED